jgi:hypothetical protein
MLGNYYPPLGLFGVWTMYGTRVYKGRAMLGLYA